jgi:hypothetical protein
LTICFCSEKIPMVHNMGCMIALRIDENGVSMV